MNIHNHQDWNIVVLRNPKATKKEGVRTHYQNSFQNRLDNSEDCTMSHQRVGLFLGQQIAQARLAKGYKTQKQLAVKLMCSPSVVNSYECGKAIPDNQMMQKLRSVLNVSLRL
jgi:putative transcription factor